MGRKRNKIGGKNMELKAVKNETKKDKNKEEKKENNTTNQVSLFKEV